MSWRWRHDTWLADCLGLPALELLPGAMTDETPCPALPREADAAFAYVRIPPGHVRTLAALTAQGFRLVDTAITLELKGLPAPPRAAAGFGIRPATPEDREAVTALARHTYHLTRFHQDPRIAAAVADDIQARWAANFFLGGRGDFMLVSHREQQITGFLLALTPDPCTMVVDLIAVDAAWQGQGMGSALMNAAQRHCHRPVARTGTQLANAASLAFYQRQGFMLCAAAHTLHRHP